MPYSKQIPKEKKPLNNQSDITNQSKIETETPNNKHDEFEEKIIQVDRVCRTVKGGKRLRFRALVAIGNKNGKVGIGIGKAQEVLTAVQKAVYCAKKNIINVPIVKGTIAHEITVDYGSSKIFLKPAKAGTSVIAGSSVRTILELAGIKNILAKILGSTNKINNAKATIIALKSIINMEKNEVTKSTKN